MKNIYTLVTPKKQDWSLSKRTVSLVYITSSNISYNERLLGALRTAERKHEL